MDKRCWARGRIGLGIMTGGGSTEKGLLEVMSCRCDVGFCGIKDESETVFEEEELIFLCLWGLDKEA